MTADMPVRQATKLELRAPGWAGPLLGDVENFHQGSTRGRQTRRRRQGEGAGGRPNLSDIQNRAPSSARRRWALSRAMPIGSGGPLVGPIDTKRTSLTPMKRSASRK